MTVKISTQQVYLVKTMQTKKMPDLLFTLLYWRPQQKGDEARTATLRAQI